MNKVEQILLNLRKFDLQKSIEKSIEDNKDLILDQNIEQVRDYGIDGSGVSISVENPYTDFTIQLKAEAGTLTNNNPSIVNLEDEGSYHNKKELIKKGDNYIIESKDEKNNDLVDKYGEAINEIEDKRVYGVIKETILFDARADFKKVLGFD